MEEADKIAKRIAIIDKGKIIAEGSGEELKKKTNKPTLEEAFLSFTGHGMREEEGSHLDTLRQVTRMWGGGQRR